MEDSRLARYLNQIRKCTDPSRLEQKFKIYNNWPVLFYGDGMKLYRKISKAFIDSPNKNGICSAWSQTDSKGFFNYDAGVVIANVFSHPHPL